MQGSDALCECAPGSTEVHEIEVDVSLFTCFGIDVAGGVYVQTGGALNNSPVYYRAEPEARYLYRQGAEWYISKKFNDVEYEIKFAGCQNTPQTAQELADYAVSGCTPAMVCENNVAWEGDGMFGVRNVTRCVCDAHFMRSTGSGACLRCPTGSYKLLLDTGESWCTACHANSDKLDPFLGIDGCGCNVGYTGPNTDGFMRPGSTQVLTEYSEGWLGEFYIYIRGTMDNPAFLGFDALIPAHKTNLLHINYPHRGTFPWAPGSFAGRWRGVIRITKAGSYSFHVNSDDGSWLWINEVMVVNNGGHHGMTVRTASVTLAVGDHDARIHWYEQGGAAGIIVHYKGPDIPNWVLLPAYTRHEKEVQVSWGSMEPEAGKCTKCDLGKYKPSTGSAPCVKCPANLHPLHNAFAAENEVLNCNVCAVGFAWNAQTQECAQCASDEFNNEAGDSMCFKCVSTPPYVPLTDSMMVWHKFDQDPPAWGPGTGPGQGNRGMIYDSSGRDSHGYFVWDVYARGQSRDTLDRQFFIEGDASLSSSSGHAVHLKAVLLGVDTSILFYFRFGGLTC